MLEAAGRDVRPLARRAGRGGARRRRRRVPQRRRQARPPPVPGRSERLRVGAALGARPQGEPRHRQARSSSGESGGGNLTLATALKAKRDGKLDQIDGVYAHVPLHLRTRTRHRPPSCPRCTRTTGTSSTVAMMGALAKVYDPTGEHDTDPLAWPLSCRRRRPRRPAAPRHLGQPARPAARRGSRLLPQAARCRCAALSAAPSTARATPATSSSPRPCPTCTLPRSATSRASPTRCELSAATRRQPSTCIANALSGSGAPTPYVASGSTASSLQVPRNRSHTLKTMPRFTAPLSTTWCRRCARPDTSSASHRPRLQLRLVCCSAWYAIEIEEHAAASSSGNPASAVNGRITNPWTGIHGCRSTRVMSYVSPR